MNKIYDYLIVGAGLFGSAFAYRAKQHNKTCLVIDKRTHIGGNLYCDYINGIHVHKYGAHIFHTSDIEVWDFVNSITEFKPFINSPLANYKGELYNLPFNMNTFHQMWDIMTPDEAYAILREQTEEAISHLQGTPRNLEEQALVLVGKDIYEKLIKGYTEKQWGRPCTELPPSIITRLPVRLSYDNNYFNDAYQGIPSNGYNPFIEKLLKGTTVKRNTDFFSKPMEYWKSLADTIVYTGPIDQFYNYKYGKLEYRTVRFETEIIDKPNYQGNAVINYTDSETPYTRIIEHKFFDQSSMYIYDIPHTVISKEYSTEWNDNMEPYYPINDEKNNSLYSLYREEAEKESNIIFGGRLAEYKYYDMAPIIRKVLDFQF